VATSCMLTSFIIQHPDDNHYVLFLSRQRRVRFLHRSLEEFYRSRDYEAEYRRTSEHTLLLR
jgi:hypothetical protein